MHLLLMSLVVLRHYPGTWGGVGLAISWLLVVMVIGFAVISAAGDKVEIVRPMGGGS